MSVSVKCFYQNIETLQPFLDFLKKDKFKDDVWDLSTMLTIFKDMWAIFVVYYILK